MPEHINKKSKQPEKSPLPGCLFALSLVVLIGCCYLLFTQIRTTILLQRGILTQATVVATSPCSGYSRQPDSSRSNQGVLLTLRFTDANGKPYTVGLPDCQLKTYQVGDHFPVRYLPDDPTTVVDASASFNTPGSFSLILPLASVGLLISAAVVVVGAFRFLDAWGLRQFAKQQRRVSHQKR